MKINRLLKALFSRRSKNQLGNYIASIPIIEKLIESDFVYIDIEKPHIVMSLELHLAHIDDELKLSRFPYATLYYMGLIERDVRYRALMDHLFVYINYKRINEGLTRLEPSHRIDFIVMGLEKKKPLLVGYYQNGEVDYAKIADFAKDGNKENWLSDIDG